MSFSSDVKKEICSVKLAGAAAQRAFLSAFLRTCGTVETFGDKFCFSVVSELDCINYFCKIFKLRYGKKCVTEKLSAHSGRVKAQFIDEAGLTVLCDLGILNFDDEGVTVSLNVGDGIAGDEKSFRAYVAGAFLGSGSITVPMIDSKKKSKTGYHLEIVFSKYVTASDFCDMLAQYGFMPKLVERKEQFVVYFKNVEEIENLIGLCGASGAYLKLTEVQIQKGIRNAENRKINCELSNMTKSIDASIRQREDIKLIADTIGLESLKPQLKEVAVARIEHEDLSLTELAELLGITKSCLTHRLRKLSEIAQSLK